MFFSVMFIHDPIRCYVFYWFTFNAIKDTGALIHIEIIEMIEKTLFNIHYTVIFRICKNNQYP